MRTAWLALAPVVAAGARPARAEDGIVSPGSRLRLRVAGNEVPVVGKLVSDDGETLVLQVASKQPAASFRLDSSESMEVSHARTDLGIGAGSLAGAGSGVLVALVGGNEDDGRVAALWGAVLALPGAAAGAKCAGNGGGVDKASLVGGAANLILWGGLALLMTRGDGWFTLSGREAAIAAAVSTGVGALAGGIAGAVGREEWRAMSPQRLRVALVPGRGGGLAAAVQLSF